jgi:hypothetical protein
MLMMHLMNKTTISNHQEPMHCLAPAFVLSGRCLGDSMFVQLLVANFLILADVLAYHCYSLIQSSQTNNFDLGVLAVRWSWSLMDRAR